MDLDGLATAIGDEQQNYSLAVETEISKTAGECRVLNIMAGAIRPSSVLATVAATAATVLAATHSHPPVQ